MAMCANNQLMLVSTANKTANLEIIENSGRLVVNWLFSAGTRGRIWKYISIPVDGVTVADLQQSGLPATEALQGLQPITG